MPLTPLLLTLGSSLLGLMGGFLLLWRANAVRRAAAWILAFAAGSILGASLLGLLPEAFEHGAETGLKLTTLLAWALTGVLVFFAVEKLLVWHHHAHVHDVETDPTHPSHLPTSPTVRPLIIIGDALHNFLDGAVIAIAYVVDPPLAIVAALAVLAHELPQEIGDFGILIASGMTRGRVILWNVLGALVSPLGAVVGLLAADRFEAIEPPLLAFAAGNFIYIALADLFPSIQHERRLGRSVGQLLLLIVGILVIWQVGVLLPHE
ncbi:MAG: ZIP family metal transporter [Candidatus Kerfeldbacteria bacterium]|nr:ZIP family metal transporter [Candidatus Kerfeldbacteria bacterium]